MSTLLYTYCTYTLLLWVGLRDRDHLCHSSRSLWMFIFIPLFEVVAALRVSFDALMNGLFSCDAQKNGNYDSVSPSTFSAFLSPVILLIANVTFCYLLTNPIFVIVCICLTEYVLFSLSSLPPFPSVCPLYHYFSLHNVLYCIYHIFVFFSLSSVNPNCGFLLQIPSITLVTVVFLWFRFSFYNCVILQKYAGCHVVLIICVSWSSSVACNEKIKNRRRKQFSHTDPQSVIYVYNMIIKMWCTLLSLWTVYILSARFSVNTVYLVSVTLSSWGTTWYQSVQHCPGPKMLIWQRLHIDPDTITLC